VRLAGRLKKSKAKASGAEARNQDNAAYRSGKPLRHPKSEIFSKLQSRRSKQAQR